MVIFIFISISASVLYHLIFVNIPETAILMPMFSVSYNIHFILLTVKLLSASRSFF